MNVLCVRVSFGVSTVGTEPGNDANKYGRATMKQWRTDLYARLRGHLCRVALHDFGRYQSDSDHITTTASTDDDDDDAAAAAVAADEDDVEGMVMMRGAAAAAAAAEASAARGLGPTVVAFAGKRQYAQLYDRVPSSVVTGRQDPDTLPPGWPFCPLQTEVWVLPSSSGRAAMTTAAREEPYVRLGERLAQMTWPRHDQE